MNDARARRAPTMVALAMVLVAISMGGSISAAVPHHHGHAVASEVASDFQREMDEGMGAMMRAMHAPGYSGDPDADFLAMMVPHHLGAVDMARLVLQHGRDPVTRQLAEEIIAGQTVEIESMRRRLALLRERRRGDDVADFPSLSGTRGPQ
jgi:hypothetical protein